MNLVEKQARCGAYSHGSSVTCSMSGVNSQMSGLFNGSKRWIAQKYGNGFGRKRLVESAEEIFGDIDPEIR